MKDQSSSFGILATGGGIYSDLYDTMTKTGGDSWKIASFDDALGRVLRDPKFAIFAGREKLIFDATRLGKHQYHINQEVFFTKYKAVVMRNGSPLRIPFDKVLSRIFESGILNQVTLVRIRSKC